MRRVRACEMENTMMVWGSDGMEWEVEKWTKREKRGLFIYRMPLHSARVNQGRSLEGSRRGHGLGRLKAEA